MLCPSFSCPSCYIDEKSWNNNRTLYAENRNFQASFAVTSCSRSERSWVHTMSTFEEKNGLLSRLHWVDVISVLPVTHVFDLKQKNWWLLLQTWQNTAGIISNVSPKIDFKEQSVIYTGFCLSRSFLLHVLPVTLTFVTGRTECCNRRDIWTELLLLLCLPVHIYPTKRCMICYNSIHELR